MLIVTELFDLAVDDFDAKKAAPCSLVVTELIVSGTQCNVFLTVTSSGYRMSD